MLNEKLGRLIAAGVVASLVGFSCVQSDENKPTPTTTAVAPDPAPAQEETSLMEAEIAKAEQERNSKIAEIGWNVFSETDSFTDKTIRYRQVGSINRVEFDFPYNGGSQGFIMFRKTGSRDEALFIVSKGQLLCSSYNGCNVQVKVGSASPQTFSMTEPASHDSDTLFFDNPARLKKLIGTADSFMVRASFFKHGYATYEFNPPNDLP